MQPPIHMDIFHGIMNETAMQTASFLQATAGSQQTPTKDKVAYSQLKECVKHATDNYGR